MDSKLDPVKTCQVTLYENISEEYFLSNVYHLRKPAVLRGFDIGPCVHKWSPDYLAEVLGSEMVNVHVTANPKMDFISKNFAYRRLSFSELIQRAAEDLHKEYFFSEHEKYYLRSLGTDPRKTVSNISEQLPDLAKDLKIPALYPVENTFSSIFRIMDNILMQIRGEKRVVLFSPQDSLNLYLSGDKSEVIDVDDPDLDRFPQFANAMQYRTVLKPGDILFIPAMWFHNTLALDFNVAVNTFWRHLDSKVYDNKDVYGNKDLLPATQALQLVDKAVKLLEDLPLDYRDFYGRRLIGKIKERTLIQQ